MNVKRVAKALKICRKYLHWVQNSVFEGEISEARLVALKVELKKIMDPEEDSVVIYIFRTTKYSVQEVIGLKKGGEEIII
jgi:CRISPR-associated protein Cas2